MQNWVSLLQDLFNNILANNEGLKNHLIGRTPNWDSERIAKIDYAFLITSIGELLYLRSIPPNVTINEYIEIAKEFSSPSSGKFINGVLDNLIKDLTNKDPKEVVIDEFIGQSIPICLYEVAHDIPKETDQILKFYFIMFILFKTFLSSVVPYCFE